MRVSFVCKLVCCALLGWFALPARGHSADIRAARVPASGHRPPQCTITLQGTITQGDKARFDAARAKAGEPGPSGEITLCLNSTGGDVQEALAIAEDIINNKNGLQTVVPAGSSCFSACAFIFMAGSACSLYSCLPARYLHRSASLGFHAPYSKDGRRVGDAQIGEIYRIAVEDIHQLSRIFSQNVEAGPTQGHNWVKQQLLSELLSAPSNSLYRINSIAKAGFYGIDVLGFPEGVRFTHRMMYDGCTNIHAWATNTALAGDRSALPPGHPDGPSLSRTRVNVERIEGGWRAILQQEVSYHFRSWSSCEITETQDAGRSVRVDNIQPITAAVWMFSPGSTQIGQ